MRSILLISNFRNETVRTELGGLHSAKSMMVSVEFAEIEALQRQNRWDEAADILIGAACSLESGGADFAIICTNTMHKLYDVIQESVQIPLLHIADATAETIKAEGIQKIGLLGTRFTMKENFYKGRLTENYGLDSVLFCLFQHFTACLTVVSSQNAAL